MTHRKVLVGLDIGSSKIRAVVGVAEERKNLINIIGVGISPSSGIRRGVVTDMDEAVSNITAALEDAERMTGEPIHRVYVGVSGSHIKMYDSKGVIAINGPNSEISENDVDRVLDAARAVSLPNNRQLLRIIPKNFSVDSQHGIKYPVGMSGIRLEVEAHIMTGDSAAMKNLEKCLYQTGVAVEEFVPSSLACAESALDRRQKELGVVLIEIGASSTNVILYEEGAVVYSSVVPVGGEHVTNDLAIGLRSTIDTAEKVKIEYGTCLVSDVGKNEEIDLSLISKVDTHSVSKEQVAKIIEARYHEIFLMVRDELIKIGRDGMLPAGAMLCGGAIKTPGVIELARGVLGLPVQISFPKDIEGIIDRVDDPTFANAVGLLHFANKYGDAGAFFEIPFSKIFGNVGQWFKKLIP